MKTIRQLADLAVLDDAILLHSAIKLSIKSVIESLEQQYDMSYDATQFGWFLICESIGDLDHPLDRLSFSLCDKVHDGELEFVQQQADWYEVYIALNDNEGVLVYVPKSLLSPYQSATLCAMSSNR